MPTLHWIGKDKVVNHHLEVPYRILQKQYTFGDVEKSENKIIHGDNLDALKSLLPEYEGKVKCIYIDPPYNTGNEGWVYNDNVSDPKLKKWLHQIVGKEGEDLTRHDKWLCMMYPRLKLLHKLLSDDGAIFISIDDNEYSNLKLIMDEIYGGKNFVTNCVWRSSDNSNNNALKFSEDYNHTLVYSKNTNWKPLFINDLAKRSHFKNPDNNPRGPWFDGNPVNNPGWRPNLQFDITTPNGKVIKHPKNGWRWSMETIQEKLSIGEIRFSDDETRLIRRTYLNEMEGLTPSNLWIELEKTGHTRSAKYDLKKIFPEVAVTSLFPTPKPYQLIDYILQLASDNDSIILDSFAGSGTTAHAVVNLNKQDGGKRKFILIETEDYAETITAERVKRVIKGYGKTDGTGGDFEYLTLGSPLMTQEGLLSSNASLEDIRSYICYTETGSHILDIPLVDHPYWLARSEDRDHYFYFERENITVLDREFLSTITESQPYYTIWADQCHLSASFMKKEGITFRKIPRDIRNI